MFCLNNCVVSKLLFYSFFESIFFFSLNPKTFLESSISIRLCLFLSFSFYIISSLSLVSFLCCSRWSFIICFPIINFLLLYPPPFSFTYTQTSLHIPSPFFFSYHLPSLPPTSSFPPSSIYHPFPFHNLAFLQSIIHQCQRLGCFLEDLSRPWSYIGRAVSPSPSSLSANNSVVKLWNAFLKITFW